MKLIDPSKLKLYNYVFGDIVYIDEFPYSEMLGKSTGEKNRPQVILQDFGKDIFLVCKISTRPNANCIPLDQNEVIQQKLYQISPGVVNTPESIMQRPSYIHHDTLVTFHRSFFKDYKHLLNQEKRKKLYTQLENKFTVNYKISDYQKLQKETFITNGVLLFEQINKNSKNVKNINMDISNELNKLGESSLNYIQEYINLLKLSTIKESLFSDVIMTNTTNIVLENAYEIEEEIYWAGEL